jgi:type IV secretory pathway VirB10-like protein
VSKPVECGQVIHVFRGRAARTRRDRTRTGCVTRDARSGPSRTLGIVVAVSVLIASIVIEPTFAGSERRRTAQASQAEINAPWEDLFSAVGRKPSPVDELAAPGPLSADSSPEPDAPASVGLAPPATQLEPPSGPIAEQPAESVVEKHHETKVARRRAERLQRRAGTRADRRRQTAKSLRSSAPARSRAEPVRHQKPSRARTAREQRRTGAQTSAVAPSPAVQLPQGLTPKHATRQH